MEVYLIGLIIIGVLILFIGLPIITIGYCKKNYNVIQ